MAYKIPLFDLNFSDEEGQAVLDTIKANWISSGPMCEQFERKFAEMLGAKYAITIANCTAALHLALDVLNIKDGDEVICPSLTFVASVNSIRYVNAIPIFCDVVSEEDLSIDPKKILELITEKTKAILVVHFAGFSCNMKEIMSIAKKYNLKVIEDACHGPLSEYHGKKLGVIGDIGCFSFFSNKNISTGEGGMIVTNNEMLYTSIKLKRSHGMTTMSYQRASGHSTAYDVVELGYNYRMDDMRAAIGLVQLNKIEKDLAQRAVVRQWYLEDLADAKDFFWIPYALNTEFSSNYIFPIVLKPYDRISRDVVRDKLHENGIQTSIHYPAVHRFTIYKSYAPRKNMAITEFVTDNEITLPMYAKLARQDVRYITDTVKKLLWSKD